MRPTETVVLLTGAARGIGRATARALAAKQYRLALIDFTSDLLQELADDLRTSGALVAASCADVRDRDALRAAVAELEARVGPTNALIACAGLGTMSTVFDLDTPGLRRMLDVNVLGVAHTIEMVLPGMLARGSGHLVGLSSVAGFRGLPWMPGYSASKAALSTYLEGLRPALKRRGIAVSNVCPGFVRTGMTVATPFRKPVPMLEPEEAARHIVMVIERRPRDYIFPRRAARGMGLVRCFPGPVFDWMMDRAGPRALAEDQYRF